MSSRTVKIAFLTISLACIYSLAVYIRAAVCQHFVKKEPHLLLFTGESALLYRYAEMVADGREIPEVDLSAQYPEGLVVRHQLSIGWEYIGAAVYRLFFKNRMDFHTFVRYFTPCFFSIAVFPLFLAIRLVGTRPAGSAVCSSSGITIGAILGTLLYAVSLPAIIRATGQEISRENYCLPLLFFHIYFFAKYLRDRKIGSAAISGLFLFAAVALWEGTEVYFYVLVLFLSLRFILERDNVKPERFSELTLPGFAVVTGFAVLAGIVIPYLRSHFFITSYSVLASLALVGAGLLVRSGKMPRGRVSKALVFISLTAALILITRGFSQYQETYSHMTALLWYKLRFLNERPGPERLPPQVRILWTPDLTEPSLRSVIFHFCTLLVLGISSLIPLIVRLFRNGIEPDEEFLLVNLLMFFLLYLMFQRMEVFLVFFVCAFIGLWIAAAGMYRRRKIVLYCLVLFFSLFEGARVMANVDSIGRPVDYSSLNDLISWINKETPRECVILSDFSISPVILTYTGRKIVLHPKYESVLMREKVEEFLFSLFAHDEQRFYSFCEKVGAQFFVYPRGTFSSRSRYSARYVTATPVTDHTCNAYYFESYPAGLEKFDLKYANLKYVVYEIYQKRDLNAAKLHLEKGTEYLENRRYQDAIAEYTECIKVYPKCVEAYARLGTAYHLQGDKENAKKFWNTAYRMQATRK